MVRCLLVWQVGFAVSTSLNCQRSGWFFSSGLWKMTD
jgi:hypothetical protein